MRLKLSGALGKQNRTVIITDVAWGKENKYTT
jgi:hypothetical protein